MKPLVVIMAVVLTVAVVAQLREQQENAASAAYQASPAGARESCLLSARAAALDIKASRDRTPAADHAAQCVRDGRITGAEVMRIRREVLR